MTVLFDELWHLIFEKLELTDLSACAQVSKKFNLLVKDYRIKGISFTRGTDFNWFHYYRSSFEPQAVSVYYSKSSVLKKSLFNFDHLKYLKVGRWSSFDLSDVNKLTSLEDLDIDLKNYEGEESLTLSLPNLTMLCVFISNQIPFLELNTPRLSNIHTFRLEKLEFVYPKSVQQISTFSHGGNLSALFPNLEYLTLTDFYSLLDFDESNELESFKDFSLTTLKNLKFISFNNNSKVYIKKNIIIIKNFIQKVLNMQRPNLAVFWQEVQVTYPNMLTEYQNMLDNNQEWIVFHIKHYEKHRYTNIPSIFVFDSLIKGLQEAGFDLRSKYLALEFWAMFCLGELRVVDRVNEPELLTEFIVKSPNLSTLRFNDSGLDLLFFRRLIELIETKNIPLKLLEIDQQLPSDLIMKLLSLPKLKAILFSADKTTIERLSPNRFQMDGKSFDLHGLLEHLKAKQKDSSNCGLM